jgi:ribosome maturation factor RimP
VLDVEDPIHGHYVLEVSSPGLDRPLRTEEHFRRQAGKLVKLVLAAGRPGRRRYKGGSRASRMACWKLRWMASGYALPLSDIESARLVPEF